MRRLLLPLLITVLVLGLSAPALATPAPADDDFRVSLTLRGCWGTVSGEISARTTEAGWHLNYETTLDAKVLSSRKEVGLRIAPGEAVLQFRGQCSSPVGDLRYIGRLSKVGYAPPTSYFSWDYRLR
ncbi:MAG: hypothetical protein JXA87_08890 [Thermoleophilia bacterium]|nr:hypothetical protein [Thermoleophilia bacterium]